MTDILKKEFINRLPHPLTAVFCGDERWPIIDIEVETGLFRIDVVGKSQCCDVGEVMKFIDADGCIYEAEEFYCY